MIKPPLHFTSNPEATLGPKDRGVSLTISLKANDWPISFGHFEIKTPQVASLIDY